jgi:hypothetical protein
MFYADLHVHSKHSRATSRDCDLEHLALWAVKKGLALVATGDFTHPGWFEEIREQLVPAEPGLYRLRADLERQVETWLDRPVDSGVRFILEVEISTIYKRDGRTRKVHHVIYAPNLESAGRVSLLTLHAAKGLEFPVVFITGCEDGLIPLHWGSPEEEDLAEERRLFFVGMTRARQRLILSHARKRRWRGKLQQSTPSPFLSDIHQELLARHRQHARKKAAPPNPQRMLFEC